MSSAGAKAVFVTCLVVNAVLWSQSRYGQSYEHQSLPQSLWKRNGPGPALMTTAEKSCSPLSYSDLSLQCAHVMESCPSPETFLSIPYLSYYFCASPPFRPLIFAGLVLWLLFLFSTLGISASDFFTPNLATIATFLGLDENVAGVTFLAFGNASPDVFSTFSAMRADSGSLAIGELLGAASFIVSVVAGSMCIIKPFKVERTPFLRDVGFFTFSVIILLVILHDGRIGAGECAFLVVMYVCYAAVVVVGSWWERRRDRREKLEALIRAEYGEDETVVEPYHDVGACLFYHFTPTILFLFIHEYIQLPLQLTRLPCLSRHQRGTGHHRVPNLHDLQSQIHTLVHCHPLSMHSPLVGTVLPHP